MNLIERVKAPTSKFFRVVRTVGISLAAVGGALIAAPVALPVGLVTAAGYVALAGGMMTAVAQASVEGE